MWPANGVRVRAYLYISKGLESALNKAWRWALTHSPAASGLVILKLMIMPYIGFRQRKLNSIMVTRAYISDASELLCSVYRYAMDGVGRRLKKTLLVRSRRNIITQNTLQEAITT